MVNITNTVDMNLSKLQEMVKDLAYHGLWGPKESDMT